MPSENILLVSPPVYETRQLTPDIGLGFIASALRENLYRVDFIDVKRDGVTLMELAERVRQGNYFMVGVKVFSSFVREANEVMAVVKKVLPDVKIVIGGPHPSYAQGEALLSCPQADVAVIGEGDGAIVELAHCFEKGKSISDVEAICYRDGDSVRVNPKKTFINVEELPLPAWDLMDPRLYGKFESLWFFCKGKNIAPVSAGRGCPFRCSFCSDFILSGKKVRYRKIESVIEEIERLHTIYGVDEIHLTDSIFTMSKSYVYKFCESLIKKNLRIRWATPYGTRLDTLDAPMLRVMEQSGCYGTSVGIESGSRRMLEFMKKGISLEKIREKINLIKKTTNFLVQGFFILGYPTETRETMQETIDFACGLPLDMAMFSPFRATPGTEIAQYLKENEPEFTPDWGSQTVEKVAYHPRGISADELTQWNKKAYRAFYLRPSVMWKFLKMTRNKKQAAILASKIKNRLFRTTNG